MKNTKFTNIAVAVSLTFSLTGCGGLSDRWQSVVKTAKLAYSGHPDVPVTRKQIEALPYASLGVRYGDSGRVLVVLGSYHKQNLHWISADKNLLVTHHGHLERTTGMDGDRIATRVLGGNPFDKGISGKGLLGLNLPYHYTQLADMQPGDRFGVPIRCTIVREGEETIEIVARHYETLRFREDCVSEVADWTFSNFYWADKNTGFIWRSKQQLVPEKPVFTIEVFKPAA